MTATDGPYRDLGSGFVRLGGSEVPRRVRSPLSTAEDVLAALLDNALQAGARNIYVASSLSRRRFRTLTVIDDGPGIPASHAKSVFDPGVTSRLQGSSHSAAGMSLHHIRSVAVEATLKHPKNPTSFTVVLDTNAVPEKTLQSLGKASTHRAARNLLTTALQTTQKHANNPDETPSIYYASPSSILATLLHNRIMQIRSEGSGLGGVTIGDLAGWGREVGVAVSTRTARRILSGDITPVSPLSSSLVGGSGAVGGGANPAPSGSGVGAVSEPLAPLRLDDEETAAIEDILASAAGRAYLSVGEVEVNSRPGEIIIRARLFELEDEYG